MKGLKIISRNLFWLSVFFLVLTPSQAQSYRDRCGCEEGSYDDPELSFKGADLVATIRYIGLGSRFEIIKSWKSGLNSGAIITLHWYHNHECLSLIPSEGIVLAYLKGRKIWEAFSCYRYIHESENDYAERIQWLDARVKQPSR